MSTGYKCRRCGQPTSNMSHADCDSCRDKILEALTAASLTGLVQRCQDFSIEDLLEEGIKRKNDVGEIAVWVAQKTFWELEKIGAFLYHCGGCDKNEDVPPDQNQSNYECICIDCEKKWRSQMETDRFKPS